MGKLELNKYQAKHKKKELISGHKINETEMSNNNKKMKNK